MTADELLRLPRGRFRHELVRGVLRAWPLKDLESGAVAAGVAASMGGHVRAHSLGKVMIGTGFQTERDPDTVRAPAIAFVRRDRVVKTSSFFPGAPDVAVEIPIDYTEKIGAWLSAGTRAVIVVDPARQSVRIHRPNETINVTDAIVVDDIVPGWRLPLSEIFEE